MGTNKPAQKDICLPATQNPPAMTSLGFVALREGEKKLHPERLMGEY